MITVREIQIGDLIDYNNQNWYVRGIEEDQLKLERFGELKSLSPNDAYPVLLTEDILTTIGFEASEKELNPSKPYREYNYNGIVINLFLLDKPVFLYCAGDTFKGNSVTYSRPPLKYLHQLQNLFFVLTGKEFDLSGLL